MNKNSLPLDDALAFFRDVVEPTVAEFLIDRADKRRGCLACLALASMTEHHFYARPDRSNGKLADFKAAIRSENAAAGLIADVANATKHVHRAKGKIGYDDVQSLEMGNVGVLRAGWPIGGEEVLVGFEHDWRLSELIEVVMTFWRDKLYPSLEGSDQEIKTKPQDNPAAKS